MIKKAERYAEQIEWRGTTVLSERRAESRHEGNIAAPATYRARKGKMERCGRKKETGGPREEDEWGKIQSSEKQRKNYRERGRMR
ncbi:putative ribonuclease ZC3H12D [Sesbania bispinosa]|nr:putative ribonuclease ZC3H12D [Sesbania bispinosa]